jgi:hypothetical protein
MWIGLLLLTFRDDFYKIRKEIEFVFSKGTYLHRLTIILSMPFILPFSIYYSIRNIKNK